VSFLAVEAPDFNPGGATPSGARKKRKHAKSFSPGPAPSGTAIPGCAPVECGQSTYRLLRHSFTRKCFSFSRHSFTLSLEGPGFVPACHRFSFSRHSPRPASLPTFRPSDVKTCKRSDDLRARHYSSQSMVGHVAECLPPSQD